jgi:hypothetical protein
MKYFESNVVDAMMNIDRNKVPYSSLLNFMMTVDDTTMADMDTITKGVMDLWPMPVHIK